MSKHNKPVLVGALLVLVGFFFGWFGLKMSGRAFSISGWEVARIAKERGAVYYLIYLLPVGALLAGLMALSDRAKAGRIATVVGGSFLAWSIFEVARVLYHTTFLGLWLTLAGALVLLLGGLTTMGSRT
jgi:hypothetical protein